MNRTLLDMIAIFVNDNQTDWDQQLPLLTAAYRSCTHDTTKYTPNMLMFGREAYLPFHFGSGMIPEDTTPSVGGNYVTNLQERLEAISELVRSHMQSAAIRQKKEYDTRKHENQYDVGSLVYRLDKLRTVGKSPKLKRSPWKGPNVVSRKISDLLYELKPSANGKSKIVHHDLLKPYVSNEIPEWASQLVEKLKPASNSTEEALKSATGLDLPTMDAPAHNTGTQTKMPDQKDKLPSMEVPDKNRSGPMTMNKNALKSKTSGKPNLKMPMASKPSSATISSDLDCQKVVFPRRSGRKAKTPKRFDW